MIEDGLMKNILVINYTKHVQYKTTAIIVGFTYIVGVVIAFMTRQLSFSDKTQIIVVIIFSLIVLVLCVYTILDSQKHINRIPKLISNLEK